MKDMLTMLLVVSGAGLLLTAAVGVVRLPDALCRGHAVAKAMTLGVILLLLALWVELGSESAGLKVPLAVLFQFATIPVGSHLVALLAFQKNVARWQEQPLADHRPPADPRNG